MKKVRRQILFGKNEKDVTSSDAMDSRVSSCTLGKGMLSENVHRIDWRNVEWLLLNKIEKGIINICVFL